MTMGTLVQGVFSCDNRMKEMAAGATLCWSGFDGVVPLPPGLNWAVAGVLANTYCESIRPGPMEAFWAATYGYLGGLGMLYMQAMAVPLSGPMVMV